MGKPGKHHRPSSSVGPWLRYFTQRIDGLSSAILVFPLFAVYQIGILTGRGQNGVDFLTRVFIEMASYDMATYLTTLGAMLVAYAAVLVLLRKAGSFAPRLFLPMLAESSFYAASMGSLIVFVISKAAPFVPGLVIGGGLGFVEVLVVSAGAGFHEELVFRVGVLGGLSWLLSGALGVRVALLGAVTASSLLFSLAHHVGPAGEPFQFAAFVYRTLAGAFFAVVYLVRGFAVAAWTHALYDVYVLTLSR